MHFTKMQSVGNDYVVLDAFADDPPSDPRILADLARAMCDRHFGVGADSLLLIAPPTEPAADATMTVLNADGSDATNLDGNIDQGVSVYDFFTDPSLTETYGFNWSGQLNGTTTIPKVVGGHDKNSLEAAVACYEAAVDTAPYIARLEADENDHEARFALAQAAMATGERDAAADQLLEIIGRDASAGLETKDREEAIDAVLAEYDVDRSVASKDVQDLLGDLISAGLVVPDP